METSIFYSKLMDYALWLLSKRSYPEQGLRNKLVMRSRKLGPDFEEKDQLRVTELVMERLKDLKYLDDLLFCERFIEERSRLKPRGKFGLNQELIKKGISKETLAKYWDSEAGLSFEELPLAVKLLEKRVKRVQDRQKLYRFLASRGFSVDSTREALDKTLGPY